MPSNPTSSSHAGLSLIGVLVAVFILVGGAVVGAQLMARTEHTVGIARERFVATSLAQEGLELVQAVRDSNWFTHDAAETGDCATTRRADGRDECWLENLCDTTGQSTAAAHQLIIDRDPGSGIAVVHSPSAQQSRLYLSPDGRWSHAIGANATPYQRIVTLDCSAQAEPASQVTVTAEVRWNSRQQDRQVVVSERLYNWYKEN